MARTLDLIMDFIIAFGMIICVIGIIQNAKRIRQVQQNQQARENGIADELGFLERAIDRGDRTAVSEAVRRLRAIFKHLH